jgi:transcription antitermination factor NusB
MYAVDITNDDPAQCIKVYWAHCGEIEEEVKDFANALVLGVSKNRSAIDKILSAHATNWQLKRMAVIDRNILRFATYELLFSNDIPPKVSINEAIDIAKKFGDKDSGKFVNGILDNINKTEKKVV